MPKWLHTKNDFKKAIKLIEDIRADTNNIKSGPGNKKVFNNFDKLINDMKNKQTTRKNTIEKIKNIVSDLDQQRQKESTVFQNRMIDVVYYLFNSLGISSKPERLRLPKWVKVSEERLSEILSTVTKAKNEGLKANVDGREITINNAERLLKDLGNGILDGHEFKNSYIIYYTIVNKSLLTRSQNKMLESLLLLKEILKPKKSDEQSDTTDMPELEIEESAAERRNQPGQGLKILIPDQMLSRLPITLA